MKLFSILRSPDQLPALQKAGADGILLGIKGLSYRIETYSIVDAIMLLKEARLFGLEVYLTLNRLLDEDDCEIAKACVDQIAQAGFNGIYFQDLAYVDFCSSTNITLIYAPEAIITNHKEVEALVSTGIHRVMAAKELTLEEVTKMASMNPDKVEVFGFGHLPMSVSRRPLVANYLEDRNLDPQLNKGTGLRLKEEKRAVFYPILEDEKETVIFSDTVFCVLNEIKQLSDQGVYAIIADDLFVDEELLCAFVGSCRRVMDGGNPQTEIQRLQSLAPDDRFSNGYFYKKTNLTKEGVNL